MLQDFLNGTTIENWCMELLRQKATKELFSEFKFKPQDKAALIVYQCRLMQEIGFGKINRSNLANFQDKVWPKIRQAVMEGLRSRRYSITDAIEKQAVSK